MIIPHKMWYYNKSLILLLLFIIYGCGIKEPILHQPFQLNNAPKKIAIFLDGTHNNESSYTNVSKLYNLTTLQNNPDIRAVYLRGVGNGADLLGMITGSGIKREVCKGYLYLAENYNHLRGDQIYIFGFSRGAYASRILAGLIYVAGIPDLQHIPKEERLQFVRKIYDAHKSKKNLRERREDVKKITKQNTLDPNNYKIEFMGLWDTVAALGIPKYDEEYYAPKNNYFDQLCNVKKAVHALSLNDNRSSIFTPVLLTQERLVATCKEVKPEDVVNEVWFFGAHSDVGGGAKNTNISGVSLNWMIDQLTEYKLLPENVNVYQDRFDKTNNPAKGFVRLFYPRRSRKLSFLVSKNGYKKEKLKIHQSVLDRLKVSLQTYEINLIKLFSECFEKNDLGGYDYIEDTECFIIEK
ncbi:DUF2235 domain-containing protein [Aquimarina sp. AD1]|uniref:phospholipase effector Tle1 domain-containing protein n=1 Tax=Aquimarina sp. (strain AD1) TaxID=1714848 RepID=UPI000E50233B|nr:DUF2235 domain-containing protein [Aquimarina sp. AD1]AXT55173.1 DUF2235 domain-containing protein [Aquimarina sp. AD1]RKN06790.1 DUF2235 domain-containing protein [Aquimarina sp. AD1]